MEGRSLDMEGKICAKRKTSQKKAGQNLLFAGKSLFLRY